MPTQIISAPCPSSPLGVNQAQASRMLLVIKISIVACYEQCHKTNLRALGEKINVNYPKNQLLG